VSGPLFSPAEIKPEDIVVKSPSFPNEYPLCMTPFRWAKNEPTRRMVNVVDTCHPSPVSFACLFALQVSVRIDAQEEPIGSIVIDLQGFQNGRIQGALNNGLFHFIGKGHLTDLIEVYIKIDHPYRVTFSQT